MRWLTNVWFRIRALIDRGRMEVDMNDEFEFHIETISVPFRRRLASSTACLAMATTSRAPFSGSPR